LVVNGMREMVEPDGQRVGRQIGREIGVGLKGLAQERTGIVVAAGQMLAQQLGHTGFAAIGDHLERIDEVLPLGRKRVNRFCSGRDFTSR
jgi:hypothetical protein